MGIVREIYITLTSTEWTMPALWWLILFFYIIPIIVGLVYVFKSVYPDYKINNYHGIVEYVRPGLKGPKGIIVRMYDRAFASERTLGANKATVPLKIEKDKIQPGNEDLFIYALADLGEISPVLVKNETERVEIELKYEGWPLCTYRGFYLKLYKEDRPERARHMKHPPPSRMQSVAHAMAHAVLSHGGIGIGLIFLELFGTGWGLLAVLMAGPGVGYGAPKTYWWYKDNNNQLWTETDQNFRYIIRPCMSSKEKFQGMRIWDVPLKYPVREKPADPTDPHLLAGIPIVFSQSPPFIQKQEEKELEVRKKRDEPPIVPIDREETKSWKTARPVLTVQELALAIRVFFKIRELCSVKIHQKQKGKRWGNTEGRDWKEIEVEVKMKDKRWSHKGYCKICIVQTKEEVSGSVTWKLEDRKGGEPKVPEPNMEAEDREFELYYGALDDLRKLKDLLRPGLWSRMEQVMSWSRPLWVVEAFQRIQDDIVMWAELGMEPVEEKFQEEPPVPGETTTEVGKKDPEDSIIEGIPDTIAGRIKQLEKLGLVVPGTQPRTDIKILADLKKMASLEHLRTLVIVGIEFFSTEGVIYEVEKDFGSPWEIEQSPLGINEYLERITLLEYQIEILKLKHEGERAGNFEEMLKGAGMELGFRKSIYSKVSLMYPTLERDMQDLMGADMPEDVKQAILARREKEEIQPVVKLPVTERLAKSLKKAVPGIEDLVDKGMSLMIVRDKDGSEKKTVEVVVEVPEGGK